MTHYAMRQILTDRLTATMPSNVRVINMPSREAVLKGSVSYPAVAVAPGAERVIKASGGQVEYQQFWSVWIIVRNLDSVSQGIGAIDEASLMIDQVKDALNFHSVKGFGNLNPENAPDPIYIAGIGYYQRVYSTTFKWSKNPSCA